MLKISKAILTFLFFGIISSILFSACGDDNPVASYDSKTITGFYGILYNYDSSENILDTRLFLEPGYASMGNDTIGADSILNLTLLIPADSMLKPMTEVAKGFGGNLSVSDASAMGTSFIRLFFFHNVFGINSGYLKRSNTPAVSSYYQGYYDVNFAYCDRKTIVSGTEILIYSFFGPPDTMKYNVNINLSKGWNPVTYYTKTARANYYEYDVYNDDPEGARWIYHNNQTVDVFRNENEMK
jgi:hypothetical protein